MESQRTDYQGQLTLLHFGCRLADLDGLLPEACVLLTDERVEALYAGQFPERPRLVLPAGEAQKNWVRVGQIIDRLMDMELSRSGCLVGIGGGVVCDIAGFVAGIFKRGIGLGLVPTTVLAQADAAVGGKNGINWGLHKNQVGLIRQPDFIAFSADWLPTLPEEEYRSGFAEIIKCALLFDADFFEFLRDGSGLFRRRDAEYLDACIRRSVGFKNAVVQQDPYERHRRKLLNFGHTYGHAIEQQFGLPHGYAVSIGMVYAAGLSMRHAGLPRADYQALLALLDSYGLPTRLPAGSPAPPPDLFKSDKKAESSGIDFILLETIGQGLIRRLPWTDLDSPEG